MRLAAVNRPGVGVVVELGDAGRLNPVEEIALADCTQTVLVAAGLGEKV